MSSVAVCYNNDCLKCGGVDLKMVRIATLIFCEKCFPEEFHTEDPVNQEKDTYLKWIEISKQKTAQKLAEPGA